MYYSRTGTTLVTVVRVLLFIMFAPLFNGVLTELFLFTAVGLRYPRNYIRISYFRIYRYAGCPIYYLPNCTPS